MGTAPEDTQNASLFTAVQEQLGLKLTATKGLVNAMVMDAADLSRLD